MRKIRIYQIFKISTDRLAREGFDLQLSYTQGVINGEVIGLGSSQLLRKMIEVVDGSPTDDLALLNYYVSVKVIFKKDYKTILKDGFRLNGYHYIRFNCSAANARNSSAFFIREDIFAPMFEAMCCGAKPEGKKMVLAKWNAYFSLNASSTLEVSEPNVAVVPDYIVPIDSDFEYIGANNKVEVKHMSIPDYNVFDGMGVMDIGYARKISDDMELGYTASCCIVRNTFIKGAVAAMDFKKFAAATGRHEVKDIYGDVHRLEDLDMILTASQFKMSGEYKSFEEYQKYSRHYGLGWGVARVNDREDKHYAFTNYQFLQVLDLSKEQIEELCQPTVSWIQSVSSGDANHAILYLCGMDSPIDPKRITDYALKALLYDNGLLEDDYFQSRILRSLNKKIRQAYSGKLLVRGNFGFMIRDPYALLEWAVGLTPKGLLRKGEYYNGFWNNLGVNKVASCRSPLTWVSENNVLSLVNSPALEDWYSHVQSGCTLYNIYGIDTFLAADSDFDGDLVFTTDTPAFIEGKNSSYVLPVTYDKVPASKAMFDFDKLGLVDMLSFGSRIGFITNCSTYWYSLLPMYAKDSDEYQELILRLKCCRKAQGSEIDKTKGLKVEPFPVRWYRQKAASGAKYEELVVCRKPYFQKYIYPALGRRYSEFMDNAQTYSLVKYGVGKDDNHDPQFLAKLSGESPVNDSPSIVNLICHYLEHKIKEIRHPAKPDQERLDDIMLDYDSPTPFEQEDVIRKMYYAYRQFKAELKETVDVLSQQSKKERKERLNVFCQAIRHEALEQLKDSVQLANIVVYVCYDIGTRESKEFAWDVFGKYILENVRKNSDYQMTMPVPNQDGNIEYLGQKFTKAVIPDWEF